MKLTNRHNLPEPLVNAVANDPYSKGDADISVTGLLSPPRKTAIEAEHAKDLEEDASDRIFSLLGQAVHTILERAGTSGVSERRMSIIVEGWKVSGATDHYFDGTLEDYKVTTVYKVMKGVDPDFERQLNMLAEIHRQNGHAVKRLRIVAILRDWSKLEARRDRDYPQSQVMVQEVTLWPQAQAQAFMRERVLMHQAARKELPQCSPEERWQKPDMYAVMKPNAKRATKLYTSYEDAQKHAAEIGKAYVVKRPGESTRCKAYCAAAQFCTQFKEAETESIEPLASVG